MASKKKPTANQIAYRKEVNRIKRFIKRAEKRGYRFERDIIPAEPSRITKARIAELKKLTPELLYRKSTALNEAGKVVPGTLRRREERKLAAKKGLDKKRLQREPAPDIYGIILSNIESLIDQYPSSKGGKYLSNLLKSQIKRFGRKAVAEAIEEHPELYEKAQQIIYYMDKSGNLHWALRSFATVIEDEILGYEYMEDIEEALSDYDDDYAG